MGNKHWPTSWGVVSNMGWDRQWASSFYIGGPHYALSPGLWSLNRVARRGPSRVRRSLLLFAGPIWEYLLRVNHRIGMPLSSVLCITLLNPHSSLMKPTLLLSFPFYRWDDWGSERLGRSHSGLPARLQSWLRMVPLLMGPDTELGALSSKLHCLWDLPLPTEPTPFPQTGANVPSIFCAESLRVINLTQTEKKFLAS